MSERLKPYLEEIIPGLLLVAVGTTIAEFAAEIPYISRVDAVTIASVGVGLAGFNAFKMLTQSFFAPKQ